MSHDNRISTVKRLNLCMNCLSSGHFIKNCNSSHKCKKCQQSHHTMIHKEIHNDAAPRFSDSSISQPLFQVASNAAVKLKSSALLMTCRVLVAAPNGSLVEVRALLDSASSASFVSERLTQSLGLPRVHQNVRVLGRHLRLPFNPLQVFRFHPHIIMEGVLNSLLSLYQRLPHC